MTKGHSSEHIIFDEARNLTSNKLPYLHRDSRSSRLTTKEVREVYLEEISKFIPHGVSRSEYLRRVMP